MLVYANKLSNSIIVSKSKCSSRNKIGKIKAIFQSKNLKYCSCRSPIRVNDTLNNNGAGDEEMGPLYTAEGASLGDLRYATRGSGSKLVVNNDKPCHGDGRDNHNDNPTIVMVGLNGPCHGDGRAKRDDN
jgi:hypothetical protein